MAYKIRKKTYITLAILLMAAYVQAAYQPLPIKRQNFDSQTKTTDRELVQKLNEVIDQLKIANAYMHIIMGQKIEPSDVN